MLSRKGIKIPIYDFKCPTCKKVTERLVKQGVATVECPNCGGIADKQVSSPGGFILNGAGFYKPSSSSSS